jgi:hypothetical protein
MKYICIKICLVIVALFGGVAGASDLPDCIEGSLNNCFGSYTWTNGDKYVGEWKNVKKNGQGTYDYSNGDKYVGEWKGDKANGQGILTFGPKSEWAGQKYVGQWKDDEKNGKGTHTYPNGDKYVGEFKDDNFNGQGTGTYADGKVKEGIWKDGEFQYAKTPTQDNEVISASSGSVSDLPDCPKNVWHSCFGTYTYDSGTVYTGEWRNGKRYGLGTVLWVNGNKFVGYFNKNQQRTGQGTYTFADGTSYVGEWKDSEKNGQGTMNFASGNKHVGQYKNNKRNGQGTYTWVSGNKYFGQYKDGKHHGQGSLTYANGDKFIGEWKDGKKNGQGTYTYPNGRTYVGEWKDGKSNGQGTETYADGTVKEGIWKDDEFQYAKTPTTAAVGTCLTKASLCSDTLLCQLAAPDVTNGKKAWFSSSSDYYKYVVEAKNRGLSCGVVSVAVSDLPDCPADTNVRWHNCFGTYTWSDGDKYVGEYKDDKRTGQGTITWASGNKYVGEFKDGKRTGQGTKTWTNGDKYVGEYKDGKRTGQGTFTWSDGNKYVGEWKDGKRTGQGTFTWSDGNKYAGEYKDGKKNGQGTLTYSPNGEWAGQKYIGEFKDGNFNGQGTFTHADGKVEEGTWKDDKLDGQATVTYADGTVKEGIWKDDEFQYAKAPTKPVPVVKTPTQDDQAIPASSGSGFAVSSDGYVITNSHVIEGCQDVVIHTPLKDIKMRVVSNDPKNDLALLKGNFTPLAVFSLSTERPEILQDIYVAGYPFGYKVSSSVKVTKGIISSLTGIGNDFSNFQIDAALQSGNSGGPILDDMGNVVGVAVAKLDLNIQILKNTANIPENTNFGIKASVVKSVLDSSSVDTPSANKSAISKSQLGKMITNGTYYISCWMTLAQIEKVRSKKVLFSELD